MHVLCLCAMVNHAEHAAKLAKVAAKATVVLKAFPARARAMVSGPVAKRLTASAAAPV